MFATVHFEVPQNHRKTMPLAGLAAPSAIGDHAYVAT